MYKQKVSGSNFLAILLGVIIQQEMNKEISITNLVFKELLITRISGNLLVKKYIVDNFSKKEMYS